MDPSSLALLLLLSAIWGASFLFIKVGVSDIAPLSFAMLRVLVGSIGLLVALRIKGRRIPISAQVWGRLAVMGAVGIALPFAAISWGTQYIPSGLAAITNASMPLFTVLLTALSGQERLTWPRVLGVLTGFGGILVLTWPQLTDSLTTGLLRMSLWGELAIVLASFSYAVAIVYARRHLVDQPPLIASLGQVSTGWLLLFPLAAALERPWAHPIPPRAIGAVLAIGLLGTSLAYILYHRLLQTVGATATSLVTYIVPLFGIFWGWLILDERLGWNAFLALALILGGVVLINKPGHRPHSALAHEHQEIDARQVAESPSGGGSS